MDDDEMNPHGFNAAALLMSAGQGNEELSCSGRVSPSTSAGEHGHEEMVKLLLAHGADRNQKDNEGKTPGDWARQFGHTKVAELLLH